MPNPRPDKALMPAPQRDRAALPPLVNPQLAAALAHPTRAHALAVLYQRPASPRELAEELEMPTRHVAYHVKRLEELGCVELAQTKQAGGGRVIEHVYRATKRSYFDADSWEGLDERQKRGVTTTLLRLASEDVNEAIVAGTIHEPDDNHLSRNVMVVDWEGWRELVDLLARTMDEVIKVQERVDERTAGVDVEMLLAKVLILHFRAPGRGAAKLG